MVSAHLALQHRVFAADGLHSNLIHCHTSFWLTGAQHPSNSAFFAIMQKLAAKIIKDLKPVPRRCRPGTATATAAAAATAAATAAAAATTTTTTSYS